MLRSDIVIIVTGIAVVMAAILFLCFNLAGAVARSLTGGW